VAAAMAAAAVVVAAVTEAGKLHRSIEQKTRCSRAARFFLPNLTLLPFRLTI